MKKPYNKIELVGSWEILQSMSSKIRKNPEDLKHIMLVESMQTLYKALSDGILLYMNDDKINDRYLYRFELQVTRQKQENQGDPRKGIKNAFTKDFPMPD